MKECISIYDALNDEFIKLKKASGNQTSRNTELITENDNLKTDLKQQKEEVVELTKKNAELKQSLDKFTKNAKGPQLANEAVKCIGCGKKMAFIFREMAFCSTDCLRSIALKLEGNESWMGGDASKLRPAKN